MNKEDLLILNRNGWVIECESPFEIRHSDGSFASNQAANIVMEFLRDDPYDKLSEPCAERERIYMMCISSDKKLKNYSYYPYMKNGELFSTEMIDEEYYLVHLNGEYKNSYHIVHKGHLQKVLK